VIFCVLSWLITFAPLPSWPYGFVVDHSGPDIVRHRDPVFVLQTTMWFTAGFEFRGLTLLNYVLCLNETQ